MASRAGAREEVQHDVVGSQCADAIDSVVISATGFGVSNTVSAPNSSLTDLPALRRLCRTPSMSSPIEIVLQPLRLRLRRNVLMPRTHRTPSSPHQMRLSCISSCHAVSVRVTASFVLASARDLVPRIGIRDRSSRLRPSSSSATLVRSRLSTVLVGRCLDLRNVRSSLPCVGRSCVSIASRRIRDSMTT